MKYIEYNKIYNFTYKIYYFNIKYLINSICKDKNMQNTWIGISITKTAQKYITNIIKTNNGIKGIKITIKKSGCAGYQYIFSIIKHHHTINKQQYYIYDNKKIKIYIPIKYMMFINETQIDLIKTDGINYTLQCTNKKIKQFCGCGNSFAIYKNNTIV